MRDVLRFGLMCAAAFVACAPNGHAANPNPVPARSPKAPLSLEQARQYLLDLVNRDRASNGVPPVSADDTAARAGQRHAEDMAHLGYTAHWGSDGSVPEERYTDAGGSDFVQENAGCVADGQTRELQKKARFEPRWLEQMEQAFMNEKPPHDGHRKNILKATHVRFGVGIAKAAGLPIACLSQEFVDDYGDYASLPKSAAAGSVLHVEGDVKPPIVFGGVGVARVDLAKPLTAAHLNTTSTYPVPAPDTTYFPKGFVTPKVVDVRGNHFSIDVPLGKGGRAGRYEVSIWGKFPGAGSELDMVSLRVVTAK